MGSSLYQHSMRGEWREMEGEIGDDVLREFVVEGTWSEIGDAIRRRYGSSVDRVRAYLPFDGRNGWGKLVAGFRS